MTRWHGVSETVDAGLLVRHLDGELEEERAEALERHVAACPACRAFAASLETRTRRVSRALERADVAGPGAEEWREVLDALRAEAGRGTAVPRQGRGRRSRRYLVAAGWVLALVGAVAAASPPLRAWVAEQWTRIVDPGPTPAAPVAPRPQDEGPGSASLDFRPAGTSTEVVVETTQAAGTLTVRFGDEAGMATVSVRGGGRERLVVGARGVRIANVPEARASYDLVVPRAVGRVSVRVGGGAPIELDRGGTAAGPVVIGLDDGTAVREPEGS